MPKTKTLEEEAYPALVELASKISALNSARVRQIKSRLVAISAVFGLIQLRLMRLWLEMNSEHLDDDNDMAEMYPTEKLATSLGDQTSPGDINPELAEAEEQEDGEARDAESISEDDSESTQASSQTLRSWRCSWKLTLLKLTASFKNYDCSE